MLLFFVGNQNSVVGNSRRVFDITFAAVAKMCARKIEEALWLNISVRFSFLPLISWWGPSQHSLREYNSKNRVVKIAVAATQQTKLPLRIWQQNESILIHPPPFRFPRENINLGGFTQSTVALTHMYHVWKWTLSYNHLITLNNRDPLVTDFTVILWRIYSGKSRVTSGFLFLPKLKCFIFKPFINCFVPLF